MFITVTAATAMVSIAINAAAVGVAGYVGYRYLREKYADMKNWVESHDRMQAENHPRQTMEEGARQ